MSNPKADTTANKHPKPPRTLVSSRKGWSSTRNFSTSRKGSPLSHKLAREPTQSSSKASLFGQAALAASKEYKNQKHPTSNTSWSTNSKSSETWYLKCNSGSSQHNDVLWSIRRPKTFLLRRRTYQRLRTFPRFQIKKRFFTVIGLLNLQASSSMHQSPPHQQYHAQVYPSFYSEISNWKTWSTTPKQK